MLTGSYKTIPSAAPITKPEQSRPVRRMLAGTLPVNFQPTGACEPLDAPAVAAFYAMGPQLRALIRQQWAGIPVGARPVTYWVANPNPTQPGNTGSRIRADRLGRGACPSHSWPSTQRALAGFIHDRRAIVLSRDGP